MNEYLSLASFYDGLTGDVEYSKWAEFYMKIFENYGCKPKLLLDLACGTGTMSYLMAKKEIEVIGVDFSEDMLIEAQSKLEDFDGKIAPIFIHQDIRELDLYGTVDSAVCSLDGINHIPEEDLNLVFGRVSLFMEPGGVFIFDINTPEHLMNMDGRTFVDETDDVFCVWRGDYYKKENCCVFGMDIFSRQENGYWLRDNEEHVEYLHSLKMLADKLQKAGFCSIQVFSELELLPPREDAARVFFAAQKSKKIYKI